MKKQNVAIKVKKMLGMLLLAMTMVNVTAMTLAPATEVYASGKEDGKDDSSSNSDELTLSGNSNDFGNMMKFIMGWVTKAGIAVLLIGAIEFAFGWYSQNPDARMTGLRIMIAGAIVIAVGVAGKKVKW